MKARSWIVLSVLVLVFFRSIEIQAACMKRNSLFKIERSINKNVVQYDACLLQNGNVSDSNPVDAYWVLADGQKEGLNIVEYKQAYGIGSKEKLGKDKFRIFLAAMKNRSILVQKINGNYKAVAQINGEPSILERVYVQSEDQTLGLPKVDYIDLFGRSLETNRPVKERFKPS